MKGSGKIVAKRERDDKSEKKRRVDEDGQLGRHLFPGVFYSQDYHILTLYQYLGKLSCRVTVTAQFTVVVIRTSAVYNELTD